jgi:hypothetical protein
VQRDELVVGAARIGRCRGLPVVIFHQRFQARTCLIGMGTVRMLLQKLLIGLAGVSRGGRFPVRCLSIASREQQSHRSDHDQTDSCVLHHILQSSRSE